MIRLLADLDPDFRPLACELIARAAEQGIPVGKGTAAGRRGE